MLIKNSLSNKNIRVYQKKYFGIGRIIAFIPEQTTN
ncbi:hypothetical protein C21_03637 [Arenibacter sp. NBRC 103722]|nr:hypothetical protein C21_03637 [Arenibacter sp. NBRC 103722]